MHLLAISFQNFLQKIEILQAMGGLSEDQLRVMKMDVASRVLIVLFIQWHHFNVSNYRSCGPHGL